MALLLKRPNTRRSYQPVVRWKGENNWELVHTFRLGSFVIPKGFCFDGASIPRFLWWWNQPSGVAFPAAVVHDWVYRHKEGTRREADNIFFANLVFTGVRPTAAFLMWMGVRAFGGCAWKRKREF